MGVSGGAGGGGGGGPSELFLGGDFCNHGGGGGGGLVSLSEPDLAPFFELWPSLPGTKLPRPACMAPRADAALAGMLIIRILVIIIVVNIL